MDPAALRFALKRVLHSRVFERALRSQRFLRYLVDAALADPPISVKEYTVAIDVFDRDTTYNSSVDATVRVEASRLRNRLREYYAEEGRADPWLIQVPKGGYNVVFTPRVSAEPVNGTADVLGTAVTGTLLELPSTDTQLSVSLAQPRRILRPKLWVGGLVLLVLAAGIRISLFYHQPHIRAAEPTEPISLAILPVVNRTGDENLNYIADGLTDNLIRQLSQVPALRLIGRTTMFRYRNRAADAEAIAKTLHADTVMTGELRHTPEHMSLTVEVTKTADRSVVLDREYIADVGELRIVQADLQRDVLAKLHVESSARDPSRALQSITSSSEAYQEFLEGDTLARTAVPANMHQAILHLEKAVALDPQFDLAWSSLADAHLFLSIYFEPPREHIPLARKYAKRALQINPSLNEAHGSLGIIHLLYDWDLPGAEAEMSTADAQIAAVSMLACTAHLLEYAGKPRIAEEMLSRILTFEPQSSLLIVELGCVNFYRGNYEAALRHYQAALRFDPQTPVAYWGMGKTLNAQGKHAEAMTVLRSFKERSGFEPPLLTAEIGYAFGASGKREQALQVVRDLSANRSRGFIDPYLVAIVYLSMNDRDAAFRWLNKALDVRSSFAISILTEPKWRPFHSDRRFVQAVQRMLTDKAPDA